MVERIADRPRLIQWMPASLVCGVVSLVYEAFA